MCSWSLLQLFHQRAIHVLQELSLIPLILLIQVNAPNVPKDILKELVPHHQNWLIDCPTGRVCSGGAVGGGEPTLSVVLVVFSSMSCMNWWIVFHLKSTLFMSCWSLLWEHYNHINCLVFWWWIVCLGNVSMGHIGLFKRQEHQI